MFENIETPLIPRGNCDSIDMTVRQNITKVVYSDKSKDPAWQEDASRMKLI